MEDLEQALATLTRTVDALECPEQERRDEQGRDEVELEPQLEPAHAG